VPQRVLLLGLVRVWRGLLRTGFWV
jgi:hypothetical protein